MTSDYKPMEPELVGACSSIDPTKPSLWEELTGQPAHSRLGASGRHRWKNCPGSVRLSQGIEQASSVYAEEGTRAHELAARWLSEGARPKELDQDQEMREHLEVYIEAVVAAMEDGGPDSKLFVEHRVHLTSLHPAAFGTLDAMVYSPRTNKLTLFDLKYGRGVVVEVEGNEQLDYYTAAALLDETLDMRCAVVELVIVQPRAYHEDGAVRRYSRPSLDIIDVVADLRQEMAATEAPDAPLNPGAWCRWCPAAAVCPAVRDDALAVSQDTFTDVTAYDVAHLAEVLTKLEMVEAWAESVRAFAYAEATKGVVIPGWKLVAKRANRKWTSEDDVLKVLGEMGVLDQAREEPKLKSPAQIEKIVKKAGMAKLKDLIVSESSGTTLVPVSDSRPVAKSDAASDFASTPLPPSAQLNP